MGTITIALDDYVSVGLPPLITAALAMLVVVYLIIQIRNAPKGNELMEEISAAIQVSITHTIIPSYNQSYHTYSYLHACRVSVLC